ncbi:nucleoside-diphosphate sugar epimerase/dehydratase [Agrococcus sp. HG114]|uniref:polysaccharide biosynthesis protein n=1 Tax=Agrococcus sp. HG114 TaxID=2969757 RepID=UPI00215ADDD2|nr:nucleoside-diphosphate sugar epimerase/dehydratase [Agrococcus sp. HG114]MCR8669855.1 polysaccharide biosynthesis protein [Agrococcus sp. HG114]
MTASSGTTLGALRAKMRVHQFIFDAIAWMVALVAAVWLRFEFGFHNTSWVAMLVLVLAAAIAQLAAGLMLSLYRRRYHVASFDEVLSLAGSVGITTVLIGIPILVFGNEAGVPRSTALIAAPLAFLAMALTRYFRRVVQERSSRPNGDAVPILVYGAGFVGSNLIKRMRTDPRSRFNPVGIIDDSPELANAVRSGVHVLGTGDQLAEIAGRTGATTLIVAIARADASLLQRISDQAAEADLRVLVLPPLDDIIEGRSAMGDVRDVSIEDIIGRHPVDTDIESVASYLTGKRVLVTGAGGSIGAELCRQISRFGPAELMMLDRDESALQAVQISIAGHGLLHTDDVVLADIRDAEAIRDLMAERRPHVVFHAAALKHLPMLEQYPDEAWKTNVLGTLNVLEGAFRAGVETFVNISTDKAANPTSVLGHSKRLAERLTASYAERGVGRYLSVRFGNVLGSRGSMLPTFKALIDAGGPLTVTHPDITRYFMTIPEACQLVMQAGAIGRPGEVLILDMGEPVKILDVAKRMIRMSGKPIEIVYTGLRPHEKLHEELIGAGEHDDRPFHEKITHARGEPLDASALSKGRWDAHWTREHERNLREDHSDDDSLTGAAQQSMHMQIGRGAVR